MPPKPFDSVQLPRSRVHVVAAPSGPSVSLVGACKGLPWEALMALSRPVGKEAHLQFEACSKPNRAWTPGSLLMALSDAVAFRPVFFGEQGLILVSGLTGRNPEWNCCLSRSSFEDRIAAGLAQSTSGGEHRPCDPMDVAHAHCILALELQILESPFKAKFPLTAGARKGGFFCC